MISETLGTNEGIKSLVRDASGRCSPIYIKTHFVLLAKAKPSFMMKNERDTSTTFLVVIDNTRIKNIIQHKYLQLVINTSSSYHRIHLNLNNYW